MGQCALRHCLEEQKAADLDQLQANTTTATEEDGGGVRRARSVRRSSPEAMFRPAALPTGFPPHSCIVNADTIVPALPPLSEHAFRPPAVVQTAMLRIVEGFSAAALSAPHPPYHPAVACSTSNPPEFVRSATPPPAPLPTRNYVLAEAAEKLAIPEAFGDIDGALSLPTRTLLTHEALQYAATSYATVLVMLGGGASYSSAPSGRKGREDSYLHCGDGMLSSGEDGKRTAAVDVTTRAIDTPLASWFLRPVKVDARLRPDTAHHPLMHCGRPASGGVPSGAWITKSETGSLGQPHLAHQRMRRTSSSLDRSIFSPSALMGGSAGGGRAASPSLGGRSTASPAHNHSTMPTISLTQAVYDADAHVTEDVLHDRLVEGLSSKPRTCVRAKGTVPPSSGLNASGQCDTSFASRDDVDAIMGLVGKGYRCAEPSNEEREERFCRGIAKARLSGVIEQPQHDNDAFSGTGHPKKKHRASPAHAGDLSCCLRYPSQQQHRQKGSDDEIGCRTLEDVELVVFQNPEALDHQQSSSSGAPAPDTPTYVQTPSTTTYNFSCDESPATLAAQLSHNASTTDVVNRRGPQHLTLVGLAAQRLLLLSACWEEAQRSGGMPDDALAFDQPLEAPAMLWEMQPRLCHLASLLEPGAGRRDGSGPLYGWDCVAPLCASRRKCAVYMILLASGVPPDASLGSQLLLAFSGFLWKPPVEDQPAAAATALSQSSLGSDSGIGAVAHACRPSGTASHHIDAMFDERNDDLIIWLIVQFRVNNDPCSIPDMP